MDKIREAWTLVGYPFLEKRGAEQATPPPTIQGCPAPGEAVQGPSEQPAPGTSTQGQSGQATATPIRTEQATQTHKYSGLDDLREKLGINSADRRERRPKKHAGRARFTRWYPDGSLYSTVQKKWRMQRDLYNFFFVLFFGLSISQIALSVAVTVLGPLGH